MDELNAAIGAARAVTAADYVCVKLFSIQEDLITLMGELATTVDDLARYLKDGFKLVTPELTAKLDQWVAEIEAQQVSFKGWATPGATPAAAMLDVARTTCRRAERRVCALHGANQLRNPEILVYLNRLSDLLWLCALARNSRKMRTSDNPRMRIQPSARLPGGVPRAMTNLTMQPPTGERLLRFVGDWVIFVAADGAPLPAGWRVLLRTNLGRAPDSRRDCPFSLPKIAARWGILA